jgi:alpha-beta hydrolase superfamily lysophospholipase
MNTHELERLAHPASSYDEACARFAALLRSDAPEVDPQSRAQLITPGSRTQRAIVLFHGLTNSPRQFGALAERFVARGYSVFIPRMPYHGYANRMNTDLAKLTLADLVDMAADAVDLAAGLADEVTVSGISLGGVLAIWAAQYRGVSVAAPIAPALGLPVLPYATTGALFGALGRLPNRFVWWDPRYKQNLPGPTYAYPRFATHALVATQRLGLELMHMARTQCPAARRIWLISNAADLAVNNAASDAIARRWQTAGANVRTFRFPRQLKLFHDLVDPLQPHARPDLVHPILERIIVDGVIPEMPAGETSQHVASSA